jgi:hypothetical protein
MKRITLKGHGTAGKTEGIALVSNESMSFMSDVDYLTGRVVNEKHDLYGENVKDKILIFRSAKGGTGTAMRIPEMVKIGTAPRGIINQIANPPVVEAAIMGGIPLVDRLDKDPIELIQTGDFVIIQADTGTVIVEKHVN